MYTLTSRYLFPTKDKQHGSKSICAGFAIPLGKSRRQF